VSALRFVGRHVGLWTMIAWASYALFVGVASPRLWVLAAVAWCVCNSIQLEASRLQEKIVCLLHEEIDLLRGRR